MKLLALLILVVTACYNPRSEIPRPEPFPVTVKNLCDGGTGSGALVGNTVFTAAHVTEDCPVALVYNDDLNFGGIAIVATETETDVATLLFMEHTGPDVEVAPAKPGRACTHNSNPKEEVKCGYILAVGTGRWNLKLSFKVVPGNSGSPIYQDGKLVGVVTARFPWRGSSILE